MEHTIYFLQRNLNTTCDESDQVVGLVDVLLYGIAPILLLTLSIVGIVLIITHLVTKCHQAWIKSQVPPLGNCSKYDVIANKGKCGQGTYVYLLDISLSHHYWVPNYELRLRGELIESQWHTFPYMRGTKMQRLIFTTPIPLSFDVDNIWLEGRMPHHISTGGTLVFPPRETRHYLPKTGIKWIRITDVMANHTKLTRCNADNLRSRLRWNVTKNSSILAYFFINTDHSIISMSYTTWGFRNGWLWGVGGSYKSFLNRSRRMLLLMTTSACVAFYSLTVPFVTDILKDSITIPDVPILQMASTSFTTMTVIHGSLSSLLAIIFMGVFEAAFRRISVRGVPCQCRRKEEEKEDIHMASSMVIIDIEEETDEGLKCTRNCCKSYTFLTLLYLLLGCATITFLGFVTLVLDGACWCKLWQWLLTVVVGVLSHALVLDPIKTVIIAIFKKHRQDDMKLF